MINPDLMHTARVKFAFYHRSTICKYCILAHWDLKGCIFNIAIEILYLLKYITIRLRTVHYSGFM